MVVRTGEPGPAGIALAGGWPIAVASGFDQRTAGIRDVEHRAPAQARQRFGGVLRRRQAWRPARRAGRDKLHYHVMRVVRHFEHMPVGEPAFDGVAVEQRRLGRATEDERELPGDVGAVHERSVDPLAAHRARKVPCVSEQETPPVAEPRGDAAVHLEIGDPAQVGDAGAGPDAGVDQRRQFRFGGRLGASVGLVPVDEQKKPILGQRREQDEAGWPDDDAHAPGRAGQGDLGVGDDVVAAVGLAIEPLAHGGAGEAVAAAGPEEIGGSHPLLASVPAQACRDSAVDQLDGCDFGSELDRDALLRKAVAEDRFRPPLRLAALEFVLRTKAGEFAQSEADLSRADEFHLLDPRALLEEWRDEAGLVEGLEHGGLKRGAARLVVRLYAALDDARPHPMAEQLAGCKKPGRPRADDHDLSLAGGRRGCRRHDVSPDPFLGLLLADRAQRWEASIIDRQPGRTSRREREGGRAGSDLDFLVRLRF